ncbi:MAG: phosphatase PAP2 family protein [bacterium]|nr:phosphatase PAP2 family protein [bacterium]
MTIDRTAAALARSNVNGQMSNVAMPLDLTLFRFLNSLAGASKLLDFIVVFFATYAPYLVALTIGAMVLCERDWRKRAYDVAVVALSLLFARGLVTEIIRFFYNRPRPFVALTDVVTLIAKNPAEPAFPSGHATFFFAFVAAYYLLGKHRGWGHVLLATTILMAIARVIAGVHYPLDVLFGAAIGVGSAYAAKAMLPRPRSAVPETGQSQ